MSYIAFSVQGIERLLVRWHLRGASGVSYLEKACGSIRVDKWKIDIRSTKHDLKRMPDWVFQDESGKPRGREALLT